MLNYNEIKNEMKEISKLPNYNIIDIKTVLPMLLYLDVDKDDSGISNKIWKKLNKNMEQWFLLPEETFEQIRYKMHVLLGTVFINEHMVGWGEVSFDGKLWDWVKGKINEIYNGFIEDEELFNKLIEMHDMDDFTNHCSGKLVFRLTEEQLLMDEADRNIFSFKEAIETSIDEEPDYTYSKILGHIYGWVFADYEICEQFDDDWEVIISRYNK